MAHVFEIFNLVNERLFTVFILIIILIIFFPVLIIVLLFLILVFLTSQVWRCRHSRWQHLILVGSIAISGAIIIWLVILKDSL